MTNYSSLNKRRKILKQGYQRNYSQIIPEYDPTDKEKYAKTQLKKCLFKNKKFRPYPHIDHVNRLIQEMIEVDDALMVLENYYDSSRKNY